MKREKLLRSRNYILAQMQLGLLNVIGNYKDKKKLKDYQLAKELGVSKGYVSQILNGTFDHKLSKVVELSFACNKMPLLYFVDIDEFVKNDLENKYYDISPMIRPINVNYFSSPDYYSILGSNDMVLLKTEKLQTSPRVVPTLGQTA
jgi:transcriptional regulator with XRE-family HTH domain